MVEFLGIPGGIVMITKRIVIAGLCVGVVTGATNAQVIVPGTDPIHLASAIGRDYNAAMFLEGTFGANVGNVTYIDLPWTSEPWIMGSKHALDYSGQLVNSNYEATFGGDVLDNPGERIRIEEFHLKGTGGLYTTDDFFVGRLEHAPAGIDPIPLYLEGFSLGQEGEFSGVGDVYVGDGGFAYYDGKRRTGMFRISDLPSGHIESELFPPGHPNFEQFLMGAAPRLSGTGVEMGLSTGGIGVGAMVNYIDGGFNLGVNTIALRTDVVYPFIYATTIPEPTTVLLLLAGSSVLLCRRDRQRLHRVSDKGIIER